MVDKQQITGLVLAGGAGRRVQGRDKGLLSWHDKSLAAHVIERMRPQVGPMLLSCNRNFELYREFKLQIVADPRPDFQGPLAGLEAITDYVHSDYIALCPCDTPLVPRDLVARLLAPFSETSGNSLDISYADDGDHRHYLCAVIRSKCLASLPSYLNQGERSVHRWYGMHNTVAVSFSDCPEAFRNLNRLG